MDEIDREISASVTSDGGGLLIVIGVVKGSALSDVLDDLEASGVLRHPLDRTHLSPSMYVEAYVIDGPSESKVISAGVGGPSGLDIAQHVAELATDEGVQVLAGVAVKAAWDRFAALVRNRGFRARPVEDWRQPGGYL